MLGVWNSFDTSVISSTDAPTPIAAVAAAARVSSPGTTPTTLKSQSTQYQKIRKQIRDKYVRRFDVICVMCQNNQWLSIGCVKKRVCVVLG